MRQILLLATGFIFFLFNFFLIPLIYANDSSPSAIQTLLQLQMEIASKAAQYKADVTKKIANKAFIGTVDDFQGQGAIINTKNGEKTVLVDQYSSYLDTTSRRPILTLKDFLKGDSLVALGDVDDKGALSAKKIIKTKPIDKKNHQAIWGQIQTIGSNLVIISKADGQKISLTYDASTSFKLGDDDASIADLKVHNFLISLTDKQGDGTNYASFIYLLNPNNSLKVSKIASLSATPSASPKK